MASSPDPPKPVDPNTIIQAQEQANRIGRITPFGSQTYDPSGNLVTSLPEGTQQAFANIQEMGSNKQQLLHRPQGFEELQNAFMNKALGHAQQQPQKGGSQQMPMPQQLGGKSVDPAWGAALNKIWGN